MVNSYLSYDNAILLKLPVETIVYTYEGEEALASVGGGVGARRFSVTLPLKAGTYSVEIQIIGAGQWTMWYYEAPFYITKPTATFDKQNGSGGTDSIQVDYSVSVPSITVPTRTGYTFQGYYTGINGTGTKYYDSNGNAAAAWNEIGGATLYAYWTYSDYTISYKDQNNAEFSGTHETGYPTQHTYNSETTLKAATRTGYTFGGWHYNSDCSDPAVTSLTATGITNNVVLYALWIINTYTVTFNTNGHGTAPSSQTIDYNGHVTVPGYITTPGFSFAGWFKEAECINPWNFATDVITQDTTLYAKWNVDGDYKPYLVNKIGGYMYDKGTMKQIVGFGFQVASDVYNSLVNDTDFGIIAYKAGTASVEYSKGTLADLKTNEGRFYLYLTSEEASATTYYAKAFVKYGGTYIYSELVNQSGNFTTEYVL